MNGIINWIAARLGLAKAWDFLDGKKAYLTGAASILTGAAGVAAEVLPLISAHNTAGLLDLAKNAAHDPAWGAILAGAAMIAGAHKADKVIEAVAAPAAEAPKQ